MTVAKIEKMLDKIRKQYCFGQDCRNCTKKDKNGVCLNEYIAEMLYIIWNAHGMLKGEGDNNER